MNLASMPTRIRRRRPAGSPSPLAEDVRKAKLTYLSPGKLARLERCLRELDHHEVEGDVLEAGIALGGSAILLAALMGPGRRFHGYDVFGMIPAPSEQDDAKTHERYAVIAAGEATGIDGDPYYGYEDDLYDQVVANFAQYGVPVDGDRVQLHKGLFEDTLFPQAPVALAHIDSDWYEPVRQCLERIHPVLSPGGFIVLDDFFAYGGCAKATHEYLAAHEDLRMVSAVEHAVITRVSAD